MSVEPSPGKMEKMKNDESKHDQPAHDHVARSVACLDVIPFFVAVRAGTPVIECEADSKINVEETATSRVIRTAQRSGPRSRRCCA